MVRAESGPVPTPVRLGMLVVGFLTVSFMARAPTWPMGYLFTPTDTGAIVLLTLTCMILLALVAWATRLTVVACMVWVGLSAVYLHVTVTGVRMQSALALAVYFATFATAGVGLYVLAEVRFRRGRIREAGRARYAARAVATLVVGSVLAVLMPGVCVAREGARRTQCRNNLHQIGLALHNYHDDHGCFPPAITTDGKGRPMHSWTVYLLPYLDEQALFDAYNFDEPHDAPANTTVAGARLNVFLCPWADTEGPPLTTYAMVVCDGSIAGVDRCPRIRDITDGPSDTILVVEASHSACAWTSPAAVVDLMRGINLPTGLPQGGSSDHSGGVFALFADGHVGFLPDDIDPAVLRGLCTMAGGEKVDGDAF